MRFAVRISYFPDFCPELSRSVVSINVTMIKEETYIASQYGVGDGYHGRKTASGERFAGPDGRRVTAIGVKMKRERPSAVRPFMRHVAFASESEASPLAKIGRGIAKPARYIAGRLICAVNVGSALAERGIKGTGCWRVLTIAGAGSPSQALWRSLTGAEAACRYCIARRGIEGVRLESQHAWRRLA
ncbi:hypothetical protein [Tardiphaga robiniae]|uniref:Uncharacterized protein n=1 Tax=Tardiphaga robiniae TaxID=943830 RepID=A0A7G6TWN5_9BRAD|nr:hypothetical protein [Tardiphaga robiniae]QND71167.1 hypothetical protein HB776_07890 [Tardiphaga robiniae]